MGLLLASATALIQVITGGSLAIGVHASYVDVNGGNVTPGDANTTFSSATTQTIVGSPAASTQRTVKSISIYNGDASASELVTVTHYDGTTTVTLLALTLLAGQSMHYDEGSGWCLIDAAGGRVETPLSGRFLGQTLLTGASGNFTTGPGTNSIRIRGVAGGGGGAGCTSVGSAASAGGGGGAGSYLETVVAVTPNTAYAYTCGAGGTGASGAAGNNGANSTFIVGATTFTCEAGSGAPVATAATTLTAYAGGTGGAVSVNGNIDSGGQPGEPGVVLIVTGPIGCSGDGASSQFGSGGVGKTAVGNGNNALGYGAGGGGALTGATTVRTGGNGTGGCWVVEEYS